ncbi:MAG: hypothetical protein JXL97_17920 [Bacteroidales bacterium]|nr:hypothetical protein [Bacteroidales bacterium]
MRKYFIQIISSLPDKFITKTSIFFSMEVKNRIKKIFFFIALISVLVLATIYILKISDTNSMNSQSGTEVAIVNYKAEVEKYASNYDLPSSYLMALIMLECSGKKNIKPRYEHHIFLKLQKFRDGKIDKFEDLTVDDVKDLSDKDLKEMAKSYGPFQIMGYKSIKLGVKVEDLQDKNAIAIGVKWINNEYGNLLREGRFKDAFHMHNTGKKFPQSGKSETYDPKYVDNGLYYIRYFSNL